MGGTLTSSLQDLVQLGLVQQLRVLGLDRLLDMHKAFSCVHRHIGTVLQVNLTNLIPTSSPVCICRPAEAALS